MFSKFGHQMFLTGNFQYLKLALTGCWFCALPHFDKILERFIQPGGMSSKIFWIFHFSFKCDDKIQLICDMVMQHRFHSVFYCLVSVSPHFNGISHFQTTFLLSLWRGSNMRALMWQDVKMCVTEWLTEVLFTTVASQRTQYQNQESSSDVKLPPITIPHHIRNLEILADTF